ncbi:PaaI family thioesterase [Peribacillus frigoritolerans]|uniref:PaaI family thioesterase n=1 Tax=Peribacillus frigoritolerans TaxID=450367 RepID=UPI0021D0290F|nr:PaaI family thioesterase [Peribacillus frigoritolerans]MCU6598985.1 PaaI family thioesterase [Peribacillus frigoritolerans]
MFVSEWDKKVEICNGFEAQMKFEMIETEEGQIILKMPVLSTKLNLNGTLHGGVYATLLDIVLGANIRKLAVDPLVTVNLNISYFAPAVEGETVIATARILHQGYKIATAEGEISNGDGKLLAKATGTFKILRS